MSNEQYVSWGDMSEVFEAASDSADQQDVLASVAQIQEQLEYEIPAGQDPLGDVEDLLVNGDPEPEPVTEPECSIDRPSSLRAPSADGKSADFAAAVDEYVHHMCSHRWPKLKNADAIQLDIMLETAAKKLTSEPTGDVEIREFSKATTGKDHVALILNLLLALLHQGHTAVLRGDEEDPMITRVMVKR